MSASERDLRVAVGHGCFSEGGDSILAPSLYEQSCKTTKEFLWLAN